MIFTAGGRMKLAVKTELKRGELIALFGVSGAGKATILWILTGLLNPDKGIIKFGDTVWFDSGNDIIVIPQNRNISLMFQDYALFPNIQSNKIFSLPSLKKIKKM